MSNIIVGADANPEITIETVSANKDVRKIAAVDKFMEDILEIEIAPSTNENDPPCVILNVNGVNQPVWRGYPTPVRRKFVEVLARMKETRYSQLPTNYINPEVSNALQPRTGLAYPFQVLKDPNSRGNAWLRAIMAEAG